MKKDTNIRNDIAKAKRNRVLTLPLEKRNKILSSNISYIIHKIKSVKYDDIFEYAREIISPNYNGNSYLCIDYKQQIDVKAPRDISKSDSTNILCNQLKNTLNCSRVALPYTSLNTKNSEGLRVIFNELSGEFNLYIDSAFISGIKFSGKYTIEFENRLRIDNDICTISISRQKSSTGLMGEDDSFYLAYYLKSDKTYSNLELDVSIDNRPISYTISSEEAEAINNIENMELQLLNLDKSNG